MLLQSFLLISTLIILGGAILTSTLVSAKVALHQQLTRATDTAMIDATADFLQWTRDNIKKNGIDKLPIWAATPQHRPIQSICYNLSYAQTPRSEIDKCSVFRVAQWNVTGYTHDIQTRSAQSTSSDATKLSTAQNEQRLSVTINVRLTNDTGQVIYADHSSEITARIFHAPPYVALTAVKDVSSERGDIKSSEGDTAGHLENNKVSPIANGLGEVNKPAAITNTTITTTTDCRNTLENSFPDPERDNNSVSFVRVRPFGNLIWSYEVPCNSSTKIDLTSAPSGYQPHQGTIYASGSSLDNPWSKDDDSGSSFAQ